jgi:hypothetical protein
MVEDMNGRLIARLCFRQIYNLTVMCGIRRFTADDDDDDDSIKKVISRCYLERA